jgi:hypothetical protein
MRDLSFEYRTTFAVIPGVFPDHSRISEDLSRISPKPPKGEDWRLVTATTVSGQSGDCTVLYFWEREAVDRTGGDVQYYR